MTLQAITSTSSMAPWSPVAVAVQRSPWHSPVPYLFGGLAAMLALIAFALSILACSYWRLSAQQRRDLESGNGNEESREGDAKPGNPKESPVFEEKYLVIMAGQANPTFLATPVSSRASPFGSCSCGSNSTSSTTEMSSSTMSEEEKQGSFDQVQVRTMESRETANQLP